MFRFRTLPPIAVVGTVLLCAAGSAQALGYGRVVNVSMLGQPLNFAATVRLDADEPLLRECIAVEVLAGEARLPSAALRVSLEPGSDTTERLIRVSTLTQIDEPVVTVNVTAGCQGRLTRSFVMLVDPPGINLAQASEGPAPSLPPQRFDSAVAPVVSVVEAAAAASAPRAPGARPGAAPSRPRVVAAPAAAVPPARTARAASEAERPRERKPPAPRVAAARREGARLQLEAAAPAVASAASAALPGEPGPVPAAAAIAAIAASAALDQAAALAAAASATSAAQAAQRRLAAVEENMAQLRDEQQATQKALLRLQASLEQAQATRYSNPMVYGLALLSALLALMVAALWWRQSQTRSASQWWLAPAAGPVPPRPPVPRRATVEVASGAGRLETQPAVMDERAVVRLLDDLPPPAPPAPPPPVEPPRPAAPPVVLVDPPVLRRELSVEELIDLEQQADFFVVLGQDDAAIDLLMGHVRSSGGASPLPYLKLLEIYRRRGEREAYERIRERFNRRFSAYAPDWDADLMQGKALDDYPRVLAQLQRLWDEPSRVTAMLDAALMRQDGSAETFDLPAYRELLFLYSIARDLGEHPSKAGAVDLLLPIEGEVPEQPIEKLTASRLMGFAETNQLTVAVDLDVTSAMPGPLSNPGGDRGFLGLVDPRLKGDGSSF